ncbi:MAG: N-acetylgalactosamine 6-sulfate sulfatase, partial [Acidobacteria bacterium]|nr:N-acetylgalactosamine 6-sulfate sulfatase [Acidobacteriota bacterium]
PFYLNYWAFSVHSPWQAKPERMAKYKGAKNAMYAAMVESLDDAVGQLTHALRENGVLDNTIVVFFSDNGGVHWPLTAPGLMHPEFEKIPATTNAPLRGGKATLYEGGTREPCIVVWPGNAKPGSVSDELVQSVDFYPSLHAMLGVAAKPGFDGIDITPALRGGRLKRDTLYCHFPHYTPLTGNTPGTWVRKGDWKLIRFYCENDDQSDKLELYNLKDDIGETVNLAARNPSKVRELNRLIDKFLVETKAAVPKRNPAYRAPVKQ